MFIDSYQVEVQQLSTLEWIVDSCFHTEYEWKPKFYRLLWMPWSRRSRPQIVGDPRVIAVVVKAEALKRARQVAFAHKPRSVRIVRIERQGAIVMKFVIWQNGRWFEE